MITRLVTATSAHFDWAIAGVRDAPFDGLRLSPGGLDSPRVLAWLKKTAEGVEDALRAPGAWFIVSGDEVVGVISFVRPPRERIAEIGYGVAERHRGRGHATRAVALMIVEAAALGLDLVAETAANNRSSQIVLERNGFRRCGERIDSEDGAMFMWRRD